MKPQRRQSWTRRIGACSACALALVLTSCGSASPAQDRSAIRKVLTSFLFAVARGAGDTACAHATPAGQQTIVNAVGPELQNFQIYGCADVVYVTGAQMSKANRAILEHAYVGKIALHGSHATVAWSQIASPTGNTSDVFPQRTPIQLTEASGVWLITKL